MKNRSTTAKYGAMVSNTPFVSVIVPVYSGMHVLPMCLDALAKQTYDHDYYEIAVVDNGANHGIEGLVSQYGNISLLHEKKPGSYGARNNGIEHCKGNILAFTDADCIPLSNWLERGVETLLSKKDFSAVGGDVRIFSSNRKPTSVELYEQAISLNQQKYIDSYFFALTANLFTYSNVFDMVGMFDDKLKSGGDCEWGQRLYDSGKRIFYAEDAIVTHPARATIKELYTKITRITGGVYTLRQKSNKSISTGRRRNILELISKNTNLLKRIFQSREYGGTWNTVQIIGVALLVILIQQVEKIRLGLGGDPKRM